MSFFGLLCSNIVEAQLLYTSDFETDIKPINRTSSSYGPLRSSGNPPVIISSENGVTPRQGTHMMKTYLNRFTSELDYRTEAVVAGFQDFNGEFEKGNGYWLGVSLYIPADWDMDYRGYRNDKLITATNSGIILQFHDRSYLDDTWRYGLPFVVRHGKSGFSISNRANGCGNRSGCDEGTPLKQFNVKDIPMLRGEWNDFVMHINFTSNADGFIRVWVNGKQEVNESGRNYYEEHTKYPYFKLGLYQANWKKATGSWSENVVWNVTERTLYHDELRIAGENSNYETVFPGGNTLAIETNDNIHFVVYPNPSGNLIKIQVPQKVKIEKILIHDNLGKEVFTKKVETSKNTITLSPNLSSGVYFLKIDSDKGVISKKIIIE